jgi:hypothetical protein
VGQSRDFELGEVIGWTFIALSLSFVVFGIRAFRKQNNGVLKFAQGFKIGLLISLFPAIGFVMYNYVYVEHLDPEFMDAYYEWAVESRQAEAPAEEHAAIEEQLAAEKAMFESTGMQALVYFMTNFILGFIVSLVSSLFLKSKYQPAVDPAVLDA